MSELFGSSPDVVLLDYQMTLVANADDPMRHALRRRGRYAEWIAREQYRAWLVELLRGVPTILITARPARWASPTLRRIAEVFPGWKLDGAYFNANGKAPPACKRSIMERFIIPAWGPPSETLYLALESNKATRAMYARLGVSAVRVPSDGSQWAALPMA